jgi:enolase
MAKKGIIKSVVAYEVLDSRGYPTVAAVVTTKDGAAGKAMVPSGASTGEREALELRDGDKARFMGKGVLKAVENVNTYIAELLKTGSFSVLDQASVDTAMIQLDQKLANSNDNFKKALGANATLAVSMAVTRAAANLLKKPLYKYIAENIIGKTDAVYTLPVPMLNVINGGEHADNTIDFQEFMFMPIGATSFKQSCQIASECFHSLAKILKKGGYNTSKGDEGGFAPALKNAEEALDSMVEAITAAGYKPGVNDGDVAIAMDTACSELYNDGVYEFKKAIKAENKTPGVGGNKKTTDQMITYLQSLVKDYPIISIEDGLAEND